MGILIELQDAIALDDFTGENDFPWRFGFFHLLLKKLHCCIGHVLPGLGHDSQRHHAVLRGGHAIERNHREILGNTHTGTQKFVHESSGLHIVDDADCRGAFFQFQKNRRQGSTAFFIESGFEEPLGVTFQVVFG